jgi:hypothetical protein
VAVPPTEALRMQSPFLTAVRVPATRVQASLGDVTLRETLPPEGALPDTVTLSPIPKLVRFVGLITGVFVMLPDATVNCSEKSDRGPVPEELMAKT